MTVSKKIEQTIEHIPNGKAFSIMDLGFPDETWEAVRVKLGRMVAKGQLSKAGKGRYYKAEKSIFGAVPLTHEEYVKDLLYDETGNIRGYLTGYSIWNIMGLTSQIPGIIEIGINGRKGNLKRGMIGVRFIPQPNKITSGNIPLLQILDSLKFLNKIPDALPEQSFLRIKGIVADLSRHDQEMLISLAEKYPPRVRAIIGVIMDEIGMSDKVAGLYHSLNPLTKYNLGIGKSIIVDPEKWHIL